MSYSPSAQEKSCRFLANNQDQVPESFLGHGYFSPWLGQ